MASPADLGPDTIPGDPDAVRAVARALGDTAEQVANVRSGITHGDVAGWTGGAHDAFAATVDKLPPKLSQVATSYGGAGSALAGYADRLADLQRRSRQAAQALGDAAAEISMQQAQHDAASARLQQASHSRDTALDPASRAHAQTLADQAGQDARRASSGVDDAKHALAGARSAAHAARAEWEQAARACAQAIHAAAKRGDRDTLGDRFHKDIIDGFPGQAVEVLGGALVTAGAATFKIVDGFGHTLFDSHALLAFVEHPSWATARKVLEVVGAWVAVIGLAVVLVGSLGAAGGALGGAAAALGSVLPAAGMTITGLETLADLEDGASATTLLFDGVDLALAGAGMAGATGRTTAELDHLAGADTETALRTGVYQYQSAATRYAQQATSLRIDAVLGFADDDVVRPTLEYIVTHAPPFASHTPSLPPSPAVSHGQGALQVMHTVAVPMGLAPTPLGGPLIEHDAAALLQPAMGVR